MEYNTRNDPIRWEASTSIKVIRGLFFASFHHFPDISITDLVTLNCRSRLRFTTFSMAIFGCKCMTSYLMSFVRFALFLTFYEIFSKQIKCKQFDLEGLRSRRTEKNGTWPIRLEMIDSMSVIFQNFSYPATYVNAKGYKHTLTHIVTQTHIQRETEAMTIVKICKAELPSTV